MILMSVSFKARFCSSFMRLTSVYLEMNGNGQDTFQSVIQKGLGLCWSLNPVPARMGCAGNTIAVSPSWSIWLQLELPIGQPLGLGNLADSCGGKNEFLVSLRCCTQLCRGFVRIIVGINQVKGVDLLY